MRINAFVSLLVVAILYQLANIAYFAAGRFCAHSDTAEVNTDFSDSFEDGAQTIDTSSRQPVLSKSFRF